MAKSNTIQDMLLCLQHYWAEQGCALLQAYDLPMGAGTFHPATFLKALGAQPWRCAYVQPCRRPADGRYGDNPNRLQHYYQFQVVLKPSPQNIQALYLDSLTALGVVDERDDIRFIEDNWESPTLAAWGLGWEVWLNGMEIGQFTYFQQMGGMECVPVTGEITYGVERLAMSLQQVDNTFDLLWSDKDGMRLSYRDLFYQNEAQQSAYNFDLANVAQLKQQFNEREQACMQLLERGLLLPAYEQVVIASHCFNLLDARGAISVTERQRYVLRTGKIANWVAKYLGEHEKREQRQSTAPESSASPKA